VRDQNIVYTKGATSGTASRKMKIAAVGNKSKITGTSHQDGPFQRDRINSVAVLNPTPMLLNKRNMPRPLSRKYTRGAASAHGDVAL
jgi:hypothetical protein